MTGGEGGDISNTASALRSSVVDTIASVARTAVKPLQYLTERSSEAVGDMMRGSGRKASFGSNSNPSGPSLRRGLDLLGAVVSEAASVAQAVAGSIVRIMPDPSSVLSSPRTSESANYISRDASGTDYGGSWSSQHTQQAPLYGQAQRQQPPQHQYPYQQHSQYPQQRQQPPQSYQWQPSAGQRDTYPQSQPQQRQGAYSVGEGGFGVE